MFNPRSFRYTGSPLSLASRSRPTVSPWPPDPSRQEPAVRARLDPVWRRPPADAGGRSTLHHRSPPHILLSHTHPSSLLCAARECSRSLLDQIHRQSVVVALAGDLAIPCAPPSTSTSDARVIVDVLRYICTQGVCVFV